MTATIAGRTAVDLAAAVRAGRVTPTEVVEACLTRIQERNADINAFITVMADSARRQAREADRALAAGADIGPLHGVPVAVKDSTAVADVPLTYGTQLLEDNIPTEHAATVARLRDAGAIVVGKTNLSEFAMYSGTHNKLVGATANPFAPEKTTAGSSGGSAAAVADGQVPLAHGTDGGGSLRMPASACGVFTIKPTFGVVGSHAPGRVDAFWHTPMLGHGPFARTVEDAALMLDVMAGPHPRDPFSAPAHGAGYREAAGQPVADLDVAYSPALDLYPIDPAVRSTVDAAVATFGSMDATVSEVTLEFDHTREEITECFMLGSAVLAAERAEQIEAAHGIDILGRDRDAILPYLVEQFEYGFEPSAVEYQQSDVVRTAVYDAIQDVLDEFDLLACATLLVPPFDNRVHEDRPGPVRVGDTRIDTSRWGPLIDWRTTQLFNMTGHPAASIPAGFTADGLPVGLQLVGRRFDDETVLSASAAYEELNPWQDQYPFAGT